MKMSLSLVAPILVNGQPRNTILTESAEICGHDVHIASGLGRVIVGGHNIALMLMPSDESFAVLLDEANSSQTVLIL